MIVFSMKQEVYFIFGVRAYISARVEIRHLITVKLYLPYRAEIRYVIIHLEIKILVTRKPNSRKANDVMMIEEM